MTDRSRRAATTWRTGAATALTVATLAMAAQVPARAQAPARMETGSADVIARFKPVPLVADMETKIVPGQFVRSLRQYNQYTQTCDEIPGHRSCVISYAGHNEARAVVMWEYARTSTGPALLLTLPSTIDRAFGLRATYSTDADAAPMQELANTPLPQLTAPGLTTQTAQLIACGVNCIYGLPVPEGSPLAAAMLSGKQLRFDFAYKVADATDPQIIVCDTRDFGAAVRDIALMPDPAHVTDTRWYAARPRPAPSDATAQPAPANGDGDGR